MELCGKYEAATIAEYIKALLQLEDVGDFYGDIDYGAWEPRPDRKYKGCTALLSDIESNYPELSELFKYDFEQRSKISIRIVLHFISGNCDYNCWWNDYNPCLPNIKALKKTETPIVFILDKIEEDPILTEEEIAAQAIVAAMYIALTNERETARRQCLFKGLDVGDSVAKPTDTAPQPLVLPEVLCGEKAKRIFAAFQQTNVYVRGESEPKPIVICYNDHWEFATKSLAAYIAETLQIELSETNMFAIIERVAGYKPRSLQNLLTKNLEPNGCREVDKVIKSIK